MNPAERRRLIDDLIEGELAEADFLRLEAELCVDPAARREYYRRVELTLLLENQAKPYSRPAEVTGRETRRWAWLAAALAAGVLLAVALWPAAERPARTSVAQGEKQVTGFGVVAGQADADWATGRSPADGGLISAGELHLLAGVARLELFSGVELVVEGEARLAVLSPMAIRVRRGRVRARVPEPAKGFRVHTDHGDVTDLGTEFAVNVAADGSEVHVIDGEVEWHPRGAKARRVGRGRAAGAAGEFVARPDEFVGDAELRRRLAASRQSRHRRWLEWSRDLDRDPRLVCRYLATPAGVAARRLKNRAGPASAGAVVAAAPSADRWGRPGGALDLSPAGSRVRVTVPGVHGSLTLLCWVKINSLDRWYNSLFLTDGHERGEPHWQIMDDGRLFFSVKKRDVFDRSKGERDKHVYFSPRFWDDSLGGRWLMIATTYDTERRAVTHYLNGKVLSRERIRQEYLVEEVRVGNASVGNWGLPKRDEPRFAVRNLNGSLDEFAFFRAALTPEEIGELYENGKP